MAHTKEKHAESEKKEAVEQTTRRSREEENALFVKLLIGFSIVQLVLGALLYLFAVVNTWGPSVRLLSSPLSAACWA